MNSLATLESTRRNKNNSATRTKLENYIFIYKNREAKKQEKNTQRIEDYLVSARQKVSE